MTSQSRAGLVRIPHANLHRLLLIRVSFITEYLFHDICREAKVPFVSILWIGAFEGRFFADAITHGGVTGKDRPPGRVIVAAL